MLWILLFSSYAFPSVFLLCLSLLNSGCAGVFFVFLFFNVLFALFLAALGLGCFAWAFCSVQLLSRI